MDLIVIEFHCDAGRLAASRGERRRNADSARSGPASERSCRFFRALACLWPVYVCVCLCMRVRRLPGVEDCFRALRRATSKSENHQVSLQRLFQLGHHAAADSFPNVHQDPSALASSCPNVIELRTTWEARREGVGGSSLLSSSLLPCLSGRAHFVVLLACC